MTFSYFLCHKDIRVAFFTSDDISVLNVKLNDNALSHLPVGVNSKQSLKHWIQNRGIPKTRDGISKDLKNIGSFKYLISNLGLSLTDCYWFQPVDSDLRWDTVNPYVNDFKDSFSLDLTKDVSIYGETNFTPSSTLSGDLRKKWLIVGGKRVLVKGNYIGCLQSISEVFATLIHKMQGFTNYVPYDFIRLSSKGKHILGCVCECFTSEKYEFVSAYDFITALGKKPNTMSYYQFYVEGCASVGVDVKSFLDYMFMTDFLISNSDRHLNNFGLLRDSDTLRFVGVAPIFDSGNSLFYKSPYVPVGKSLLRLECTSFYSKEIDLLKTVTNRYLVDTQRLPAPKVLYNLLGKDLSISDERKNRIVKAYEQKIRYFTDFQNNPSVFFSYKYQR